MNALLQSVNIVCFIVHVCLLQFTEGYFYYANNYSPLNKLPEMGWVVGQWEDCNVTCGGGWQWRQVYCAQKINNDDGVTENQKVPEKFCWQTKKPENGRACAKQHCPVWEVGDWSACSVTCDKGLKKREVKCHQARFRDTNRYACDPMTKPDTEQVCYTGVACDRTTEEHLFTTLAGNSNSDQERYVAAAPFSGGGWNSLSGTASLHGGGGARPHWMPGQWTQCTRTCGPGVRTRDLRCVAFQPMTGNVLEMPDYECEDTAKPVSFEPCKVRECDVTSTDTTPKAAYTSAVLQGHEYRWQYGDWSECSASCLGGTQRSTLECVDVSNKKSVAWSYCNPRQRPQDVIRPCNHKQCPPRWESGSWSVCASTCGGAVRTRRIRCIREISRNGGADSVLILPDSMCSDEPKPRDREPCAEIDCQPSWSTDNWSPCSRTCGSGDQHRRIRCIQRMADSTTREIIPPTDCDPNTRPTTFQLCNMGNCDGTKPAQKPHSLEKPETPFSSTINSAKPEAKPKPVERPPTETKPNKNKAPSSKPSKSKGTKGSSKNTKALTLGLGASATLFQGMSVKVKCPAPKFDRSKIKWMRNGRIIQSGDHVRISNRGALRIIRARQSDSGTYVCLTNGIRGNVTLNFKPRMKPLYPSKTRTGQQIKSNRMESLPPPPPGADSKLGEQAHPTENTGKSQDLKLKSNKLDDPDPSSEQLYEDEYNDEEYTSVEDQQRENKLEPIVSNGKLMERPKPVSDKDLQASDKESKHKMVMSNENVISQLRDYFQSERNTKMQAALSKPNVEVRLVWVRGQWSPCSKTCGDVEGMQVRQVQCKVTVSGDESYTDSGFCEQAGKMKPPETQLCAIQACPNWETTDWTDCEASRCVSYRSALQRRKAHCVFPNGTRVGREYCNRKTRPSLKHKCFNKKCVGTWRPDKWGPCSVSCGANGVETRTISCTWHGTRKAAGVSCDSRHKPVGQRRCDPQPPPCLDQPDITGLLSWRGWKQKQEEFSKLHKARNPAKWNAFEPTVFL